MSKQNNKPNTSLGILAYGSLIVCPGQELESHITQRICTITPFRVEFSRESRSRCCAPTLVPDERGCNVRAAILVLDPSVTEEEARNMLYRRELNRVADHTLVYDDTQQRAKKDALVIETLPDEGRQGQVLLYVHLAANIALLAQPDATIAQKAAELARLACGSVTSETYPAGRDGVRYLADAIRYGIQTPLTDLYRTAVLRLAGDAPDLEAARRHLARQKGLIPEEDG